MLTYICKYLFNSTVETGELTLPPGNEEGLMWKSVKGLLRRTDVFGLMSRVVSKSGVVSKLNTYLTDFF